MKSDDIKFLERGSYLSFATRKKSGELVATPVWFAPDEGSYFVFSAGDAGKVKRLRNFSQARVAACTVTGKRTGEWHTARAHLLEKPVDRDRALRALRRKYGWQMAIGDTFGKITGKMRQRAYIRIDLDGD